ncbi:hypothetical protein TIFTF001_016747 [Ficus carica]|uniref:Uncharacterized protein n=1 Tax=Ficus carica TaxID=3494 RepID=A0AA88D918_FICCA|nr:hypothetical protein TIFTF001_016747 [Ficus carica]
MQNSHGLDGKTGWQWRWRRRLLKKEREGRATLKATEECGGGDGGVAGDGRMRKKGGPRRRHRENKREGQAVAGRATAMSVDKQRR